MESIIRYFAFTTLLIFVLGSCSSSELVSTWKDEEFTKNNKFHKLLVIAIGKNEDRQKLFENLFKKNLEAENVEAVKSYPILGPNRKLLKQEVLKLVSDLNVDGVLITHLKNTEVEGAYSPNIPTQMSGSNLGSMYTYYNSAYEYVHTPGSYQQKIKVYLETRLFDVKEERLVWSAVSATIDPDNVRDAIEEIQALIIDQMKADQLF